jgi:hypothetical protein
MEHDSPAILAFLNALLAVAQGRGFRIIQPGSGTDNPGDVVIRTPHGDVQAGVTEAASSSTHEILGRFAVGILEARRASARNDFTPLVVVAVPGLSSETKQVVGKFMATHAPDIGWGIADRYGAVRLAIPSLQIDLDQPGHIHRPKWRRQHPVRLFSDLNRWMLKILLLAEVSPSFWPGPRQRISSPTELHRVARVSVEKAHQFFRAFEQAGFVRQARDGLTVVRKRTLMQMWFHNELARTQVTVPARWLFGEPSSLQEVFSKAGAPTGFAIGGFEACRLLGVLHAPVAQRRVHVFGEVESGLEDWSLEACDDRDAHFHLCKARYPQSILRGFLVKDDLPVVDILQAALDVRGQAARGEEQAEYIVNEVLGWRD